MNFISSLISELPLFLLSLPMVLLALSVHETAHGYVAYKLGDPTAYNLGRLTLNPVKHFDPIGLIFMTVFHVGWAKPVPINTRHFKKPKRDMALTAAAGPVSNIFLALLLAGLLRLTVLLADHFFLEDLNTIFVAIFTNSLESVAVSAGTKLLSVLAYILWVGMSLNISLAVFNMLPVPPFDGSRIAHVYLPTKWYFAIMRYERIFLAVIIGSLILTDAFFPSQGSWLSIVSDWISGGFLWLFGMPNGSGASNELYAMVIYVAQALSF